jgi:hypothetical protein
MTIFVLDKNPVNTAKYLEDRLLHKQIIESTHVLCNIHYEYARSLPCDAYTQICGACEYKNSIPLPEYLGRHSWFDWAIASKENYIRLQILAVECVREQTFRKAHSTLMPSSKTVEALDFCEQVPPLLSDKAGTQYPNTTIKKYHDGNIISTYRKYFTFKINQAIRYKKYSKPLPKWTKREAPLWLKLCE